MRQIKDERELIGTVSGDIKTTNKKIIILLGGHFPLLYEKDSDAAIEAFSKWGQFSLYTLELSCKIASYARKIGKEIKFVFFVDDHSYEELGDLSPTARSKRRNGLYRKRSGEGAELPQEYRKIMKKYGFAEKDVLRHDHGKAGRHDCLYFSEKILRTSPRKIDNACAREYTEFIENKKYFDKDDHYMVAFIPNRCQDNICNFGLDKEINGLSASHIFLETLLPTVVKNDLFVMGRGVTYRKDNQ